MTDSKDLLGEYARNGSEAAFRELVTRYIDLVYSSALRIVEGDTHRAEDVAQVVFVDLARQAPKLGRQTMLGGWLHRATCFAAAKVMRGERRREVREREAAEMKALNHAGTGLGDIAPILDQAINALAEEDRKAIVLRFYERLDLRAVGAALGSSENAAQKRVSRALEELRRALSRRGVTRSATIVATVLASEAVTAAPVGLATAISGSALTAAATGSTTGFTLLKLMAMSKLKLGTALTIAACAAAGLYESWQASSLRHQLQTAQAQQRWLEEKNTDLEQERNEAGGKLAALRDENQLLNRNGSELLKLRAETARLKAAEKPTGQVDITEAAMRSWISRVKEFKRLPERMPDKAIPELRLLTEEDWLELAKRPLGHDPAEVNLEDDRIARLAFNTVRGKAKDKLMRVFSRALEGYAEANNGDLPTEPAQLQPYLMNSHFAGPARVVEIPESSVDEAVFSRYEMLQSGKLEAVPKDATILAEKAPVDDEYDTCLKVGRFWMGVGDLADYSREKRIKQE